VTADDGGKKRERDNLGRKTHEEIVERAITFIQRRAAKRETHTHIVHIYVKEVQDRTVLDRFQDWECTVVLYAIYIKKPQ